MFLRIAFLCQKKTIGLFCPKNKVIVLISLSPPSSSSPPFFPPISSSGLFPPAWQQRVMGEVMSVWRLQLLQRNNDSELMLIRKKEDANITRARSSFRLITLLIYLSARVLNLSSASSKGPQCDEEHKNHRRYTPSKVLCAEFLIKKICYNTCLH